MDPETARVLQAACYSAGAFGCIYAIAKYSFQKRKSDNETSIADNETYCQRSEARTKSAKEELEISRQELEISRQKVELMQTPGFQDYLTRRHDAMEEFVVCNSEWLDWDTDVVDKTLDSIVGPNPIR